MCAYCCLCLPIAVARGVVEYIAGYVTKGEHARSREELMQVVDGILEQCGLRGGSAPSSASADHADPASANAGSASAAPAAAVAAAPANASAPADAAAPPRPPALRTSRAMMMSALSRIGFVFARARTVSEQEAALLLMGRELAFTSREFVWVGARMPNARIRTLRPLRDMAGLPDNSRDTVADSILEKYAARNPALERLTLYEYARDFRPGRGRRPAGGQSSTASDPSLLPARPLDRQQAQQPQEWSSPPQPPQSQQQLSPSSLSQSDTAQRQQRRARPIANITMAPSSSSSSSSLSSSSSSSSSSADGRPARARPIASIVLQSDPFAVPPQPAPPLSHSLPQPLPVAPSRDPATIRDGERFGETVRRAHGREAIVRVPRLNRDTDGQEYFYQQLLLHVPWRDESALVPVDQTPEQRFRQLRPQLEEQVRQATGIGAEFLHELEVALQDAELAHEQHPHRRPHPPDMDLLDDTAFRATDRHLDGAFIGEPSVPDESAVSTESRDAAAARAALGPGDPEDVSDGDDRHDESEAAGNESGGNINDNLHARARRSSRLTAAARTEADDVGGEEEDTQEDRRLRAVESGDRMPERVYYQRIASLGLSQSTVFRLVQGVYVQRRDYSLHTAGVTRPVQPLVLYISAAGGCGKTYLLSVLVELTERHSVARSAPSSFASYGSRVLVMAPTGMAASLLPNGRTLHSALGLRQGHGGTLVPPSSSGPNEQLLRDRCRNLCAIFLDEISMVSDQAFEAISARLSTLRNDSRPFGGVDVFIFGDLYQLTPV
jgi:hypothetical protein